MCELLGEKTILVYLLTFPSSYGRSKEEKGEKLQGKNKPIGKCFTRIMQELLRNSVKK